MGDPMQPPMGDPTQGQPPMDPMQAQGLEALTQPMEEQPMEEPMMAANGGLMNINLPDDYYDEDSYSHGGIAHFALGDEVQEEFMSKIKTEADRRRVLEKEKQEEAREAELADRNKSLFKQMEYDYSKSSALESSKRNRLIAEIATKSGSAYGPTARKLNNMTTSELQNILGNQPAVPTTQGSSAVNPTESIGFNKPLDLGRDVNELLEIPRPKKPPPALPNSMMLPGKTAGMAEMQPEDDSNSIENQYFALLGKQYPGAPASTETAAPEQDFSAVYEKRLKELQDAQSKPSKARDEYLAALNEQQPLKDTSKQDFWRTIGEMSSKLTEGSLEGKGLLEAAAGATSVLPGSVSRSIENKKAREDAAKADRLTKLATMYGIDTNDRAAMADLAKTAFDMTEKQADRIETLRHNKEVERKGREDTDYERFMDEKQFGLKALEAQMKDGGGNKFTEIKRAVYEDLQAKHGMSSQEAAIETARIFSQLGKSGSEGKGFAPQTPDQQRAIDMATDTVMKRHVHTGDYDPFAPEIQDEIYREANQNLKNAGLDPMTRLDEGVRSYNSQGEPE